MKFNEAKKILTKLSYWEDVLRYEMDVKTSYLSTIFTTLNISTDMNYTSVDDCFYIGDLIINLSYKSKTFYAQNDNLIFNLYYKKLDYCDTLYIDYQLNAITYTKAIRIRNDKNLNDSIIKDKMKQIIYEFKQLYMLNQALKNYNIDSITNQNIEKKLKNIKNI